MYGRNRYKQAAVETAQPGDLVVMLYDGVIRFIRDAERGVAEGDIRLTGRGIERAVNVITYLQATLSQDPAPEIARSLSETYTAWSILLVKARGERDLEALASIREQVANLRDAWDQINREAKANGVPRSAA